VKGSLHAKNQLDSSSCFDAMPACGGPAESKYRATIASRGNNTLSGNSLRQTVHTHCASVHQAAKVVAALLRVAGVTVGLAESNGSLPPGL